MKREAYNEFINVERDMITVLQPGYLDESRYSETLIGVVDL